MLSLFQPEIKEHLALIQVDTSRSSSQLNGNNNNNNNAENDMYDVCFVVENCEFFSLK